MTRNREKARKRAAEEFRKMRENEAKAARLHRKKEKKDDFAYFCALSKMDQAHEKDDPFMRK